MNLFKLRSKKPDTKLDIRIDQSLGAITLDRASEAYLKAMVQQIDEILRAEPGVSSLVRATHVWYPSNTHRVPGVEVHTWWSYISPEPEGALGGARSFTLNFRRFQNGLTWESIESVSFELIRNRSPKFKIGSNPILIWRTSPGGKIDSESDFLPTIYSVRDLAQIDKDFLPALHAAVELDPDESFSPGDMLSTWPSNNSYILRESIEFI